MAVYSRFWRTSIVVSFLHGIPESFWLFALGIFNIAAALHLPRASAQPSLEQAPNFPSVGLEPVP